MNKYKLVNTATKEVHICEKVTIGDFDYYVSDDKLERKDVCITNTQAVYQNNQQSLNKQLVVIDKEIIDEHEIICQVIFADDAVYLPFDVYELKKVIATNNPSIGMPQTIEVVYLGLQCAENSLSLSSHKYDHLSVFYGFEKGYIKSEKEKPFAEDDMLEFAEFCSNYDYRVLGNKTPKQLLEIFKSQQVKTIYYEQI